MLKLAIVLHIPLEQAEGDQAEVSNVLCVPLEQALGRQKQAYKSTAQSLGKQKHPAKSSVILGNHQLHHPFLISCALIIQLFILFSLTYFHFPHTVIFLAFLQFN